MSGSGQATRQVFLLGLDQAEWNLLESLVAQGRLRFLGDLLATSKGGPIKAPPPSDRIAQWTTLATGKRAHQHGVYCSTRAREDGRGSIPATWAASTAVHLGEIVCARGMHVHQIGWPGASPAPPLDGIVVDPQFAALPSERVPRTPSGRPWCHPPVAAAELYSRRVDPRDIDEVTLAGLIPSNLRGSGAEHTLVPMCRQALAETSTLFRVARFAVGITPWDLMLCALPLLGRISHLAGELVAQTGDRELADAMQRGAYEHLDLLVGQLLQQTGSAVDVVLVGMGRQRPFAIYQTTQDLVAWSAKASLLDVVPTLLSLFGLPIADDMPGESWISTQPDGRPLESIASWDKVAARVATPEESSSAWPPEPPEAADAADDRVQHLLDLGYVDPVATAARQEAKRLGDVAKFHRALSLADAGAAEEALHLLTHLAEASPTWISVGNARADLALRLGCVDQAANSLQRLIEHGAESAQLYLLQARIALTKRDLPAAEQALEVARRIDPHLAGLPLLRGVVASRQSDYPTAAEAFRLAIQVAGSTAAAEEGLALCRFAEGQLDEAADHALRAIACDPTYARAHYRLGRILTTLERPGDARLALLRAAELDPVLAAPYYWLARLTKDPGEQDLLRRQGLTILKRTGPRGIL